MEATPRLVRLSRAALVLLTALLAVHVGRTLTGSAGPLPEAAIDVGAAAAIVLGAAAMCLWRAVAVRRERWAWAAFGAAALSAAAGWMVAPSASAAAEPPPPSLADGLWLAFYPLACLGVVLLVRARLDRDRVGAWLDGLVLALGAATVSTAVLLGLPLGVAGAASAEVAVGLAYPIADAVLLGLVVGALPVVMRRPGPMWLFLLAALAACSLADGVYLVESAAGTYAAGGPVDSLWPAAAVLLATAAWVPSGPGAARPRRAPRAFPVHTALAAVGAIAVLAVDHLHRLDTAAVLLASATLLAVVVRAVAAVRESERTLGRLGRQARTDALTGLGNRRRLDEDLAAVLPQAAGHPWLLVMLDLDGFKVYNDAFGHPAGDALLARLGGALLAAAGPGGSAYRTGGDEFCVLQPLLGIDAEATVEAASAALREEGPGFRVEASLGAVFLPEEARSPVEALRAADRRMYADKTRRRGAAAGIETLDALRRAIQEREPGLDDHLDGVVSLTGRVARHLGVPAEEREDLARAAALHDVGKLAVPDGILRKAGPLSEAEAELMRSHTVVGERILAAVPSLMQASRIVRSSHERWDGRGYPDGLAGTDIPLGARIVAACDAYDAMVSDRCYRRALTPAEALREVERCAGAQFDPAVARALREALAREPAGAGDLTPV